MSRKNQPIRRIILTLLFPPAGLIVLWFEHDKLWRKIAGSVTVFLYCPIYAAWVIWLLMFTTGLQVEWRGGFPPVLTYSKTLPNYGAVERDRARKAKIDLNPPASPTPTAAYWTDFRGPQRDGHYDEQSIRTNWPAAGLPLLWRQPVGGGYASFTIAEGLAFTIEQRRELEVTAAYSVATGREFWTNAWPALFQESMGGDGPRATPTYHEGRVYALGAKGELRCIGAKSGTPIWAKNILRDNGAPNLQWAMSASPLVIDGKVIVQPGGAGGRSIVAYDAMTGKTAWQALSDGADYSSPMVVTLAGTRQLVIAVETRVVGLRPEDGKLLWEIPWKVNLNNRNIAQPVLLGSDRFFLSAGYGTGCEAVEISRTNGAFSARTVWKNTWLKNKFTSSVFWNGYIYGLDEDILTCLDATTGERKWKDGRYGYGQLLLASGNLVVLSGEGKLALVKATPGRFEELALFQAIQGKTWNNPAIAEGRLLVRNAVEMACFDITPDGLLKAALP